MSNYKTLKEDKFKDNTNIVDSGTEGTKVAVGTTGQRGTTIGQFRFNSTTGLAEYYDGSTYKVIDSPPVISSISPTSIGESGLGSNQTIVITGDNFSTSPTVKIIGNDGTEITPALMNYLTQLIEKEGTFVSGTIINVNGTPNFNSILNNRATVNEFDVYINGQYIDKNAYNWSPSNLSTQTITFDTAVLGYELEADDVVIVNGRWSE